jgi:hypothetical protein
MLHVIRGSLNTYPRAYGMGSSCGRHCCWPIARLTAIALTYDACDAPSGCLRFFCDQELKRLAKGIGAYGCGEDGLRA